MGIDKETQRGIDREVQRRIDTEAQRGIDREAQRGIDRDEKELLGLLPSCYNHFAVVALLVKMNPVVVACQSEVKVSRAYTCSSQEFP